MSKCEAVKVIFCVVVSALLSIFPSLVHCSLSVCLPVIYNQEQKEMKKKNNKKQVQKENSSNQGLAS